ncbi:glycosyltransferase [Rhodopseudomonas palustris]|nr:glycosyltransferase [Rhodopseudomonas palustris]
MSTAKTTARHDASDPYICLISILVPVYNTPPDVLDATIQSVLAQTFSDWELCICDDCSTDPQTLSVLDSYKGTDRRIKIVRAPTNLNISRATNLCAEIATGEFVGFLDHDDVLEPDALAEVAAVLQRDADVDVLYTDEDKLEPDGSLTEPYFKPDWSPEHLTSVMYVLHFTVVRKSLFFDVGMLRHEFAGAQDYDLALRVCGRARKIVHIPKILYHWRKIPGSAAAAVDAKPAALINARAALLDYARQRDPEATVDLGQLHGLFRLNWSAGRRPDPVTLLILTDSRRRDVPGRGDILMVDHFIDSIFEKSTFRAFKIVVVDNGNLPADIRAKFEKLGVRVHSYAFEPPFNFSNKANFSIDKVETEDVIILNDDLEVISPDWIEALLGFSRQPEIGAVGCRLRFADDRIQHAGIALGLTSPCGHIFYNRPADAPGYLGFTHLVRNYSAVTGAVLATTMSKLREVGGFDENLRIDYNDIDLCLRLGEKGYRIVYTPHAELYHFERSSSARNAPDDSDTANFVARWKGVLQRDPHMNPNFVGDREKLSDNLDLIF